ncbi:CHAT domain-containing protein [Actinomadura citrea]|uniref:CHAT domain-containing protein n=1 Tax=Actinomadura citrea TaxID=46158 RepID=UPI003CE4E3E9
MTTGNDVTGWLLQRRPGTSTSLPDVLRPGRASARTTGDAIGTLDADLRYWQFRRLELPQVRQHIGAAIAAGAIAWIADAGTVPTALLALFALSWWRRWYLWIPALGGLLWTDWEIMWIPCIVVVALFFMRASASLREVLPKASMGVAPFAFVPLRDQVALRFAGRWSDFCTGVDKAVHDDTRRAEAFFGRLPADLPAASRAIVQVARATSEAKRGRLDEGLGLAAVGGENRELSDPVRGWCDLHLGDLLVMAGQHADAAAAYERALTRLRGRRCRPWLIIAETRAVDLAVREKRPGDAVVGLSRLRRLAVRHTDLPLIVRTEMHLARLMLDVGNVGGAQETLERLGSAHGRRGVAGAGQVEAAEHDLLRAELLMRNPAAPLSADEVADQVIELAGNALLGLRRLVRPAAETAAHLVLAEARARRGDRRDALAHALEALRTVQALRFQLPSTAWRERWLTLHATAFVTAIENAWECQEALCLAELIETLRAQPLPIPRDEPGTALASILDALLTETAGVILDDAEEPSPRGPIPAADPLEAPFPVVVGGRSWCLMSDEQPIDIDAELAGFGADTWYLSAAFVGPWFFRVAAHDGVWTVERAARPAMERDRLESLLDALPIRRPGEDKETFDERVDKSPLSSSARRQLGDDPEFALLRSIAEELLPAPLAGGLTAAPQGDSVLVVSLSGSLVSIPVAALPLPAAGSGSGAGKDVRIADVAAVAHVPSWAVVAHSRKARAEHAAPGAVDLALLGPDNTKEHLQRHNDIRLNLEPPPLARETVHGPLDRAALSELLRKVTEEDPACLYVAGHVETPRKDEPGSGGIKIAGGSLFGSRDLLQSAAGTARFPMPSRVILACCESLGQVTTRGEPDRGHVLHNEWLGIGAGMLMAGAQHVYCTLYPISDLDDVVRVNHALARALATTSNPLRALCEVQREELRRWRAGNRTRPLAWQPYVYVGTGHPVPPGREAC